MKKLVIKYSKKVEKTEPQHSIGPDKWYGKHEKSRKYEQECWLHKIVWQLEACENVEKKMILVHGLRVIVTRTSDPKWGWNSGEMYAKPL